jgi:hypothetical protein
MTRWLRGADEIRALLASGDLQQLTGAAADGRHLLHRAETTLATARSIVSTDPDSAFVLAYDAARQALTALLAHQGLRPTTKGGHYAVDLASRAQFGPGLRHFGMLRRRRNELEYPEHPGDDSSTAEAVQAADHAQGIITAAQSLIEQLGVF